MKLVGITLLIIGAMLYLYSLGMEPYQDETQYKEEYYSIDRGNLGRATAMEQYYNLRSSQLTGKFKIQDYGLTLISLGLVLILMFWKGVQSVRAPNSKTRIAIVGILAALGTIAAYVGDLFLEFFRESFPYWADSLGIPLAGVPVLLMILLIWVFLNLLGLKGNFLAGEKLLIRKMSGINYWYLILSIVTLLIVLMVIFTGFFWLVIPGILWLYFYLSILAGRYAANKAKQRTT